MPRFLIAAAATVILSACATQRPICPVDTTTAFDAAITQINTPALRPATEHPSAIRADVGYSITIQNRSSEPLHIRQITLDPPHLIGDYRATQQCFGIGRIGAEVQTVTRGFDRSIEPGGSASFEMWTSQTIPDPSLMAETAKVVTLFVRVDAPNGARSEKLTRKVTFKVASSGRNS